MSLAAKSIEKVQILVIWPTLVETDAQTLVWLLNQPPNDLPNAIMTRWLTYIRLFDFDINHIPGNKNGVTDALSRHGQSPDDPEALENEADDYFDAQLYSMYVPHGSPPTARMMEMKKNIDSKSFICYVARVLSLVSMLPFFFCFGFLCLRDCSFIADRLVFV